MNQRAAAHGTTTLERGIFDCGESIAVSYPPNGRHLPGKLHLSPIPRAGVALSPGIHVEGERALRELRAAIDHALGEASGG